MTLSEKLEKSENYEQFVGEATLDKKKFWNHTSKKMYVPSLKYAFKKLKERVEDGECIDEIMEKYLW